MADAQPHIDVRSDAYVETQVEVAAEEALEDTAAEEHASVVSSSPPPPSQPLGTAIANAVDAQP